MRFGYLFVLLIFLALCAIDAYAQEVYAPLPYDPYYGHYVDNDSAYTQRNYNFQADHRAVPVVVPNVPTQRTQPRYVKVVPVPVPAPVARVAPPPIPVPAYDDNDGGYVAPNSGYYAPPTQLAPPPSSVQDDEDEDVYNRM